MSNWVWVALRIYNALRIFKSYRAFEAEPISEIVLARPGFGPRSPSPQVVRRYHESLIHD